MALAPQRPPVRRGGRSVRVTAALALAVAAMALMQTISIPLLPALPMIFETDIAAVSWVATSTLIVGAAVNPIVGRMGDLYGKRSLMLGCLAAAVVGSVLGAVAGSLPLVVAARAVQGIGSGVIPLAYGIVRDELPENQLARAVSVITAAGAALGAGLGPVLMGGVLTDHGWRAVFWVTAGLCLLALVLVAAETRGSSARSPVRFDIAGAVVLAVILVVVLVGITNGASWGWTSPRVVAMIALAAGLAVWWVHWELTRPAPLVDLALSSTGRVLLAHLGGLMVGYTTFTQYIVTFTLVSMPADTGVGLGRTAAVAGLVQLPGAAAMAITVLVAARMSVTRGAHALLRFGAGAIVVGLVLTMLRHGTVGELVLSVTVVNVGLGAGFCALPILIMENVALEQTAAVNAVNALARVIGSVLGSAVVSAIMATGSVVVAGQQRPGAWTFVASCGIAGVIAAAAGVLAHREGRRPRAGLAHNSS